MISIADAMRGIKRRQFVKKRFLNQRVILTICKSQNIKNLASLMSGRREIKKNKLIEQSSKRTKFYEKTFRK